jgi:AcrR family transcriptional regulator
VSPKRRYDPDAARRDILDSAEELFTERGFGDVSTATIAKAAGVSQSQIHYHFETKRGLYYEVFRRRFAEYFEVQAELLARIDEEGIERMRASVVAYFRFFQEHPRFAKLMMRANLDAVHDHVDDPMTGALLRSGAEVIADSQRRGEIRDDVPADIILLQFLALVAYWFYNREHHLADLEHAGPPESHDEAYLEGVLKVYLQGIAPPRGS